MTTAQLSVTIALREAIFKCTNIVSIISDLEEQSSRIEMTSSDVDGTYAYIKVTDSEMQMSEIAEEVIGIIAHKMADLELEWILTSLDIDLSAAINVIRDCEPSLIFTIDRSLNRKEKDGRIYYIEQCSVGN